jgi:hypothetical protein
MWAAQTYTIGLLSGGDGLFSMAKSREVKYVPRQPQAKAEMPKLPEMIDSQNKTCDQVFWGVLIGGEALALVMIYFGGKNLAEALSAEPNWGVITMAALLIIFGLITAIGTFRASLVMAVMTAARTMSFEACRQYCMKAVKARAFIPGGVAWAIQTLLEFMVQKGEFDQVIEVGEREYNAALAKNPKEYGFGSVCACVGTAYSMKQDFHKAVDWLEKAGGQYKDMFASLEKGNKTAKIPGGADNVYLRYAETMLALSGSYLRLNDKRNAKEKVSMVYELTKKVKDGPEKETILKRAQEIGKYLKHW